MGLATTILRRITMSKKDVTLKLADGKSHVEKFEVTGFENLVPEIRKLDGEMDKLQQKRQDMRNILMNRVREIKKVEEGKGLLYKTFVIQSEDGVPANILFKNSFSKLDSENEDAMVDVLGNTFHELFERNEVVVLKKNVNMDDVRKALGKNFDVFFEEKKFISFVKDFMERHMSMRRHLPKKINAMLDKWASENQASPDLRMKG